MELSNKNRNSQFIDFSIAEKGKFYWRASWYADVLGYASLKSLTPSIDKAKMACMQIGISVEDNFIPDHSKLKIDYKLTKFACFLIAHQADSRKPMVKRARSYFLNELDEINILLDNQDYLQRTLERNELAMMNKQLSKTARAAHVKDFQFFMNEGYLGMYNHTMNELKKIRNISPNDNISDYQTVTEMIANIFRISLTKERLKSLRNPSEQIAAREHWKIGKDIRVLIKKNTGKYPEELPLKASLVSLQRELKKAQKELNQVIRTKTIK